MSLRVLIIDDERVVGWSLKEHLEKAGIEVYRAGSGSEGLAAFKRNQPDIVLLDLELPDADGMELIGAFAKHPSHAATVVIITAFPRAELAVQALREGAHNYIVKPVEPAFLLEQLHRIEDHLRWKPDPAKTGSGLDLSRYETATPAVRAALRLAREAAHTDSAICIIGERGTGREELARSIHLASDRRNEPVFSWGRPAKEESSIEAYSELIGAEAGAFHEDSDRVRGLLEQVGAGTLVIRNIDQLNEQGQQLIQRILTNRLFQPINGKLQQFRGRLIFTASPRLLAEDSKHMISAELRQLVLGHRIYLPALHERQKDFKFIVAGIMDELNSRYGTKVKEIEPKALLALTNHRWTGNIAELKLFLEQLWLSIDTTKLTFDMLPSSFDKTSAKEEAIPGILLPLAEIEKAHILLAMEVTGGNQTKAAKALGIARSTLISKLKQYGWQSSSGSDSAERPN